MVHTIAFYLPQFHPIPENDAWYGKGFTEWTNTAKASPLFPGHYQPHVPADLGFYDLRLAETRREQAKMAAKYGLSAFCYWYYWFGDGEQLLEMPVWEMYKDEQIRLPFCIAWANAKWKNKMWDSRGSNRILKEQKYLGEKDYTKFFYKVLPLFKDRRYYRVGGKLLFLVHQPLDCPDMDVFLKVWRNLAEKEKIGEFYFIGEDSACRAKNKILSLGFDAVYDNRVGGVHHDLPLYRKLILFVLRNLFKCPTVFRYKEAAKHMVLPDAADDKVFPVAAPNWDHSPRTGRASIIYHDCKPKYFYKLLIDTIDLISKKPNEKQIIFIKSWNEWGEGNHLEPDLKYGKGYLRALKKAVDYSNMGK